MADVNAAPRGVSIVTALVVTLASPVLGYAAFRNAALDAAGGAADPSAVLLPRSVAPQLQAMMRSAKQPQAKLPPKAAELARAAAVKMPLAYEPYYIAARVQEQAGRYREATRLMEEARRRRPNATWVRVALLGYYSLADAYQKAIDEADMAMRIDVNSSSLILPGFAKLVSLDPKARQAIAVALAKNPPWRQAFLVEAAKAKMTPEAAEALVGDVRRLSPSATPQAEEAFLVRTLMAAGNYRAARARWDQYQGKTASTANAVVDPNFRGRPADEPFGWTFLTGQDGTAEIGKVSAQAPSYLETDYFGGKDVALAEQTLAAPPGTHRLSSTFTGESSSPDVRVAWSVKCLPSNKELGRLQLEPLQERPVHHEMTVTIPGSGCEGQSLGLVGQPAEIPRILSAQISEVSLVPSVAPGRKR